MTEEKPQKKRVVSRARYAEYLVKKMGLKSIGDTLYFTGLFGMITTGLLGIAYLMGVLTIGTGIVTIIRTDGDRTQAAFGSSLVNLFANASLFCFAFLAYRMGREARETSRKLETVVPLTRQNAEQLPPEESLVRGSQPPAQSPETLLRAAQPDGTPVDQLLRPGP